MTTKLQLADRARELVRLNALILDTETTGLGDDAEIVEIAICDARGHLEFSALVKPTKPIPPEASNVHGITDEMVAEAMGWADLHEIVNQILFARKVLAFNADYDHRLIRQTAIQSNSVYIVKDWGCLMKAYQEFAGLSRWPRLAAACEAIGYTFEGAAHRAMADAKAARAILLHMAAYQEPQQAVLLEVPVVASGEYVSGEV